MKNKISKHPPKFVPADHIGDGGKKVWYVDTKYVIYEANSLQEAMVLWANDGQAEVLSVGSVG